ncbi:MAG: Hint domain-containing protein [Pseudomonadota bacterium]
MDRIGDFHHEDALAWPVDLPSEAEDVGAASPDAGNAAADANAICFCPGTRVLTLNGWRPVECLRVGDRVLTRDSGAQRIRWIGRRAFAGTGPLAPVEVARGVLGADRPVRLSPQHRLLLSGPHIAALTGEAEALCPALHLVDGARIRRRQTPWVTYLHLMFDKHEVIWADGLAAESFRLGPATAAAMTPAMRREFEALFPGQLARAARPGGRAPLARRSLGRDAAALVAASAG